MTLLRRDLLKRLPALPFLAVGAAAALPRAIQGIGTGLANKGSSLPWATISGGTVTLAEKEEWFLEDVGYMTKPLMSLPAETEALTLASVRAAVAWDKYFQAIASSAKEYGIAIERAEELVGHAIRPAGTALHLPG